MTRQEGSSDILDDIQPEMGLNSQGKNIYLQLHPNFHLTAAALGCFSATLADSTSEQMQIEVSYTWNAFIPVSNNSQSKECFRCIRLRV